MRLQKLNQVKPKTLAFLAGSAFLFLYWWFGYDGITFSDDVYYLIAGKRFWEGTMIVNSYHFSSRWGAYVPAGLVGKILGFEPHRISLISLLSYAASLWMLIKVLPEKSNPWILVLWFSTQVYFLHFLTKVYPDSLLVFWTVLIPFSAYFRKSKPFLAALGVVMGLFFGFLTKETIVFLAPLPIILFFIDRVNPSFSSKFYLYLTSLAIVTTVVYLGYFWVSFGDPFYRISSINSGHYISEFTYADKGLRAILRRLSYLPIITFVERGYWPWIVFGLAGIWKIREQRYSSPILEYACASILILTGFWVMSSTLEFYNPIYLNPRHLILLVPILSFLIAVGWKRWTDDPILKKWILVLFFIGISISAVQQDLKMLGFQGLIFVWILSAKLPFRNLLLTGTLLFPTVFAIRYQKDLKNYSGLIETLNKINLSNDNQDIILTNSFINFSKEVLLPSDTNSQSRLISIEKTDSVLGLQPEKLQVLLHFYHQHAYPEEQQEVDHLEDRLKAEYQLIDQKEIHQITWRTFIRKTE